VQVPPTPSPPAGGPTARRTGRRAFLGVAAFAAAALTGGAALAGWWGGRATAHARVSLEQARAELEAGTAVLIDIREPDEHATGVAAGARLLPMRQLARRLDEIPADPAARVLLICNTQNRSRASLLALHERGLTHLRYVHGGMSEWARRGWPMVRPDGQALAAR
jgi:rhodanese-related sulfurtransferase